MEPQVGKLAPNFELADQDNKNHKLSDYKGKKVLLYFYPKDFTSGCTTEACSLRDNFPRFGGVNAEIIGISTDSVKSHKKFADKYRLPFTILADEKKEVVKLYNVWQPKKFLGKECLGTLRTSFLIDEEGRVAKIYEKVNPAKHTQEVLADLG